MYCLLYTSSLSKRVCVSLSAKAAERLVRASLSKLTTNQIIDSYCFVYKRDLFVYYRMNHSSRVGEIPHRRIKSANPRQRGPIRWNSWTDGGRLIKQPSEESEKLPQFWQTAEIVYSPDERRKSREMRLQVFATASVALLFSPCTIQCKGTVFSPEF